MMKRRPMVSALFIPVVICVLILAGCGNGGTDGDVTAPAENKAQTGATGSPASGFSVQSADFNDGGELPLSMACSEKGGQNISPELSWLNAPQKTTLYALVMDDEDPPCGSGADACRHWAVFNLPAGTGGLEAGADLSGFAGVTQGENSRGEESYAGPCPPEQHTYHITVYALQEGMPDIPQGTAMTRASFEESYSDFILAQATIGGSFKP